MILDVEEASIGRCMLELFSKPLSCFEISIDGTDVNDGDLICVGFSCWCCRYVPVDRPIGRTEFQFLERVLLCLGHCSHG